MQSVFKLPLAVYALHLVEGGKFSLDQPIRFLPSDRILPETYSPLQDKYPNGDVDVPLRELLRLAASLSDNAAADTVLRVAGGPAQVDGHEFCAFSPEPGQRSPPTSHPLRGARTDRL